MIPTIGNWYRVTSGPHRGRTGVCDLVDARANGVFFRITNREMIVGRFPAEMLEPANNPQSAYESKLSDEVRQMGLDVLMGRVRS